MVGSGYCKNSANFCQKFVNDTTQTCGAGYTLCSPPTTPATTTVLDKTATTTTKSSVCPVAGFKGPTLLTTGPPGAKIQGSSGVFKQSTLEICHYHCQDSSECESFSFREDKGNCQLFSAKGPATSHTAFSFYFRTSNCDATVPTTTPTTIDATSTTTSSTITSTPTTMAVVSTATAKPAAGGFANNQLPLELVVTSQSGEATSIAMLTKESNSSGYEGIARFATGVQGGIVQVRTSIPGVGAASVGGITNKKHAANKVMGVLLTSRVFEGETTIVAMFRVTNGEHLSADNLGAEVEMSVTGAGSSIRTTTQKCGGAGKMGRCTINLQFDQGAFTSGSTLAVSYGIRGASMKSLGKVHVAKAPAKISLANSGTISVELPHRSIYPKESFTVDAMSQFKKHLQAAVIEVTASNGLDVAQIQKIGTEMEITTTKNTLPSGTIYVVTVLRKKGSQISRDVQPQPTNEKLFQVLLVASGTASTTSPGTLTIKLRPKQTFDMTDNELTESAPSVVRARDGVKETSNSVYFIQDDIVGILPYATNSNVKPTPVAAELFNSARLTGKEKQMQIIVEGIRRRKGVAVLNADQSVSCTSDDTLILKVKSTSQFKCTAVLDGTETNGGVAHVTVSKSGLADQTVSFRTFLLDAASLKLTSSVGPLLRPIAGLYDENDPTCQKLQFQETKVTATATFSDGTSAFTNYDVSKHIRLASSNDNIATVSSTGSSPSVQAVGAGTVKVTVLGYSSDGSSLALEVADPRNPANHVAVAGLDCVVLSALGALELKPNVPSQGYDRDTTVTVHLANPAAVVLKKEGQKTRVAVTAVLADQSRLRLNTAKGLVLASTNEKAIKIDPAGDFVFVPKDPVEAHGNLVTATWRPAGSCFKAAIASQSVTLSVVPALPTALKVSLSRSFLVPRNDPAAESNSFSTSLGVTVRAVFADKSELDVTSDVRTQYFGSDDSLVTVNKQGLVVSNAVGTIGSAAVTVKFRGANATASIAVAKFKDLIVSAAPYPAYSGSGGYKMRKLRAIACTQPVVYQKATVSTRMVLTNDKSALLQAATYTLSASNIVDETGGLLSPKANAEGTVRVTANFVGSFPSSPVTSSAAWSIEVSTTKQAKVQSIDNLRHMVGNRPTATFSGTKGSAAGQVAFGVTLDDTTQYVQAMSNSGIQQLTGVFSFKSAADEAIAVNAATGATVLKDNAANAVGLDVVAMACDVAGSVTKQLPVYANLQPAVLGDVDLGSSNQAPLAPCKVGLTVEVPVAVNTGDKTLTGFEMSVAYDSQYLEYVKYTPKVRSSDGKADILASNNPGASGTSSTVSINGLIQNTKVKGSKTSPYVLFSISFKCVKSGDTTLSGSILKLVEAVTTDSIGVATKSKPISFVAGSIPVIITGARQARRDTVVPHVPRSGSLVVPLPRLRRAAADDLWRRFDANCDGEFGVDDGAVILQFLAFGNKEIRVDSNPAWKTFRDKIVAKCSTVFPYDKRLDLDGNKAVTLLDVTYVQNVLVGYYYLYDVQVAGPSASSCDTTVTVQLQGVSTDGKAGTDPKQVSVYVDVATEKSSAAIDAALKKSTLLETANKGDKKLFGGLVRTVQNQQDPQLFVFKLPDPGPQLQTPTVLFFSPLLVKSKTITDTWLQHNHPFLDVLASSDISSNAKLPGSLTYELTAFETSGNLPSKVVRPNGYKPLTSFSLTRDACSSGATTATATSLAVSTATGKDVSTPASTSTDVQPGDATTSAIAETAATVNAVLEFMIQSAQLFNPLENEVLANGLKDIIEQRLTTQKSASAVLAKADIKEILFRPVADERASNQYRVYAVLNADVPTKMAEAMSKDLAVSTQRAPVNVMSQSFALNFEGLVYSPPVDLSLRMPAETTPSVVVTTVAAGATVVSTQDGGILPHGNATGGAPGGSTQSAVGPKTTVVRCRPGYAGCTTSGPLVTKTPAPTNVNADGSTDEKVSGSADIVVYTVIAIVAFIFVCIIAITIRAFVCKESDDAETAAIQARYDMEWGNDGRTPMYANNMATGEPAQNSMSLPSASDVNMAALNPRMQRPTEWNIPGQEADPVTGLATAVNSTYTQNNDIEMKTFSDGTGTLDIYDGHTMPSDNDGYLSCSTHI